MIHALALPLLASVLLLPSCGNDGGGGGKKKTTSAPVVEEQVAEGAYRAILRPLNNQLSGFIPTGAAEITIRGDEVRVKTLLDDDARVPHRQAIQLSTRCPTPGDDANGDGVVDVAEAYKASGDVFVPLDSDLNGAELGAGVYPVGSGFTYLETASLRELEADARARTGQNLNLGGRVILVHGVASGTPLPATAATIEHLPREATVPIACGVVLRVNDAGVHP
jgi:hypothetical protein